MADTDTALLGTIMRSMPFSEVLGGPLKAMMDAQSKGSHDTAQFILSVGFTTDEDGIRQAVNVTFEHDLARGDGGHATQSVTMPLIAMIPIPCLMITHGQIILDVEVSQNAEVSEKIAAGGEAEGSIGWGPFSVKLKASASYSKDSTRKTDTRAKQHIEMTVEQCPLPEGMSLVLETLRNGALERPARPQAPALPQAQPEAEAAV